MDFLVKSAYHVLGRLSAKRSTIECNTLRSHENYQYQIKSIENRNRRTLNMR